MIKDKTNDYNYKNITIWFLMFFIVFAMVFVMVLASDREYEANQEREKIYFDRVEEMRK